MSTGPSSTRDRKVGWWLVAAQALLLLVIVVAPVSGRWTLPSWARAAALALGLAGVAVLVLGAGRLGRALRVHPEPSATATMRTGGAYRFARHPMYSGLLLLATGVSMNSGSPVSAAAALALLVVLTVKSAVEERLLRARFPGYAAYARTAGRFLPRLRRTR